MGESITERGGRPASWDCMKEVTRPPLRTSAVDLRVCMFVQTLGCRVSQWPSVEAARQGQRLRAKSAPYVNTLSTSVTPRPSISEPPCRAFSESGRKSPVFCDEKKKMGHAMNLRSPDCCRLRIYVNLRFSTYPLLFSTFIQSIIICYVYVYSLLRKQSHHAYR